MARRRTTLHSVDVEPDNTQDISQASASTPNKETTVKDDPLSHLMALGVSPLMGSGADPNFKKDDAHVDDIPSKPDTAPQPSADPKPDTPAFVAPPSLDKNKDSSTPINKVESQEERLARINRYRSIAGLPPLDDPKDDPKPTSGQSGGFTQVIAQIIQSMRKPDAKRIAIVHKLDAANTLTRECLLCCQEVGNGNELANTFLGKCNDLKGLYSDLNKDIQSMDGTHSGSLNAHYKSSFQQIMNAVNDNNSKVNFDLSGMFSRWFSAFRSPASPSHQADDANNQPTPT